MDITHGLQFHHIGVVTADFSGAINFYQSLGYEITVEIEDPIQKAKVAILKSTQGPLIEIISPLKKESPAFGWLERIKAGPYHTCYESSDVKTAAESLISKGFEAVSEIVPAVAFEGRKIIFLWAKHVGLIELLED